MAFQQHAIPQQISSYEFQLVGSMTLKQFFKLAGGLIIAFLIFSTKIPVFIKWPLSIGSAGLGAALAFIPFNEQPLEIFIINFIKCMFSTPSIFLWKKAGQTIDILESNRKDEEEEGIEKVDISKTLPQLEEFLQTLTPKPTGQPTKWFEPDVVSTITLEKPESQTIISEQHNEEKLVIPQPTTTVTPVNVVTPPAATTVYQAPAAGVTPFDYQQGTNTLPAVQATTDVAFGDIPLPEPPTTPNIVVGMVLDSNHKIIEDTIIEIQDSFGNPVRALRTNKLGQFKTAAPLANGEYVIIIEKEGLNFDIMKFKAEGQIIPTMKIIAKLV